ncbi:MAG: aminotransferase class V-fold PLP-dependent enzyme [Bacteriovoracaceae bacterium]|jgi:selenocysteine lyase/cysteine desulfurase|nr:aminotransferase class V-fold PLP-dependent enzyme [Bacteriovoracaceae bacterium]
MNNYKKYYQKFLNGHEGKIHLASHSHYFWPDISFTGQQSYWKLSAKHSDEKWNYIFNNAIPKAQKHIAKILNFKGHERITFAPNTQELLARVISSFSKKIKILTTDSEFHSAQRQFLRLKEASLIDLDIIPTEEEKFEKKFLEKINDEIQIIFLSQVFFNSGISCSMDFIQRIIKKKATKTLLIIDGYHAFCAVDTNLESIIDDIFYIAGGYKYAQAGEGMCFMSVPKNCTLRPVNTGWFANFSKLEDFCQSIDYSDNGFRFASSTLDFSALFRFNAIWDFFLQEGFTHKTFIQYSKKQQEYFISSLHPSIQKKLVSQDLSAIGLFVCFELQTTDTAQKFFNFLNENNILTDLRGSRVRISFPVYNDLKQLDFVLIKIHEYFM